LELELKEPTFLVGSFIIDETIVEIVPHADRYSWQGDSWRFPGTGVVRELLECGQVVKRICRFPLV
jgi:hypothetical protein